MRKHRTIGDVSFCSFWRSWGHILPLPGVSWGRFPLDIFVVFGTLLDVGWGRFLGLKILDIFILKKFLGTYFFATILILAIISMFDITEKLDAFLNAPLKETLFDYFLSFLPYFANQLAPLFTFISAIFFTTK